VRSPTTFLASVGMIAALASVLASSCASPGSSRPPGVGATAGNDGGSGGVDGTTGGDDENDGGLFGTSPEGGDASRPARCDDAGDCTCINVASIGHEGVWGPCSTDSTTALQNWLNTQSTAKVDNYDTAKPTLTPAFLAQYDVILLQWMVASGQKDDDGAPWVFSASEITALQDWVNGGGGIIALSGYQCNGMGCTIYDTTATNQLLSFTDISLNADDMLDPATVGCQDCYCWGGSLPLGGPVGDAGVAPSYGSWGQSSPIGAHLSDVGEYIGRSIHSTSATVDNTDGTHQFAVHEQVGKGHVFVFGDEWVTYSGEWLGTATCLSASMFTNPSDPCYEKSAAEVFQIPQFWYNAIKYASSSVECFTVMNPGVIQ
jgi:hypothetical protein